MSEDLSKQFLWSRPSFKNRDEEVSHLYKTYEKMMTVEATPPLPSREEELSYLKYLENSFYKDPWITLHPKLYQASPYRGYYIYWKELQKEYRKTFLKNFFASVAISWPLII
jgi:hypothetical protein